MSIQFTPRFTSISFGQRSNDQIRAQLSQALYGDGTTPWLLIKEAVDSLSSNGPLPGRPVWTSAGRRSELDRFA